MKSILRFCFFPFLIPLFYCLHGYSQNMGLITWVTLRNTFLVQVFYIGVFILLFYFLFKRNIAKAALFISVTATYFLFFADIKNALAPIPSVSKYTVFLPLSLLSLFILCFYLRRKNIDIDKTTVFLNVLMMALCLSTLIPIFSQPTAVAKKATAYPMVLDSIKTKPNVYILLFDEYAGNKTLKKNFNYDNQGFYDSLEKLNFTFLPVVSNYDNTPYCLSSFFNIGYLDDLKIFDTVGWQQRKKALFQIKSNKVFSTFEKIGYQITTHGLFETDYNHAIGATSMAPGSKRILNKKNMHHTLMNDIGWRFLKSKNNFIFQLSENYFLDDLPSYNKDMEHQFYSFLLAKNEDPSFYYGHFLMPHFPYLFDSIGNEIKAGISKIDGIRPNEYYVSYLKYCNKKIIEYCKAIIKKDKNAVIVVLSDHGFRARASIEELDSFDNICAFYNPQKQTILKDSSSLVNLFPIVFNNYFNQRITYLPTQQFYIAESKQSSTHE